MVYNYLTIQKTSILSKQAFSVASHTITKIHNHLNPKTTYVFLYLKN